MRAEPEMIAIEPDFLIAAKPPDLLSHPTKPDGRPTLLGWLRDKFPGEFVALVNRLDRETSGLILVARTPEAASHFGAMTMRREIGKEYLALVAGRVTDKHGLINAPIGRLGISEGNPIWLRQGVIAADDEQGRRTASAQSDFWRVSTNGSGTLLRLRAHTGRLHQLRVHLASIGHPVLGDKIYGPDSNLYLKFIAEGWTEEHARRLPLSHHALHAHRLEFLWKDEARVFTSPMPEDMRALARKFGWEEAGGSAW
jgi:23S rRNA pseudouridine1911/1915/1917 synthase